MIARGGLSFLLSVLQMMVVVALPSEDGGTGSSANNLSNATDHFPVAVTVSSNSKASPVKILHLLLQLRFQIQYTSGTSFIPAAWDQRGAYN